MECTALTVVEQPVLPAELVDLLETAHDFAKASRSANTLAAYDSDWRIFAFCLERGLEPLPATVAAVCAFLTHQAQSGKKSSTLGRRLDAIRHFSRLAGFDSPTSDEKVSAVFSGIKRTIG